MLFGAALGAGWSWLAIIMGLNVALSLSYYLRVIEPLYFRPLSGASLGLTPPLTLRLALVGLGVGTLLSGVFPQPWVALAQHASVVLASGMLR